MRECIFMRRLRSHWWLYKQWSVKSQTSWIVTSYKWMKLWLGVHRLFCDSVTPCYDTGTDDVICHAILHLHVTHWRTRAQMRHEQLGSHRILDWLTGGQLTHWHNPSQSTNSIACYLRAEQWEKQMGLHVYQCWMQLKDIREPDRIGMWVHKGHK